MNYFKKTSPHRAQDVACRIVMSVLKENKTEPWVVYARINTNKFSDYKLTS